MPTELINGFRHYWEDLGDGEALVMFHGAASAGKLLLPHARELAKHFRVIIPDMRGLGRSERVSSIPADAWVEDLSALLDFLEVESAHIYGTSLGARVALRFAISHPAKTKSVILDNAIIAFEAPGNEAMNSRLADPESMPDPEVERYRNLHGDDWMDAVRAYFAWRNDPAVHDYYDLRESCERLTMPVLLVRGDAREPVHPIEHTFELFRKIKTARLWIKPEGGCFTTAEGYERIRSFVADPAKQPVMTRM